MTDRLSPRTKNRASIATVVVPTDFSAESLKALRYAAGLVRKFGAKLHVVHVSEVDFAVPGPSQPGRNLQLSETQIREELEAGTGDSIAATVHGRTGRAFDQICRFAREIEADLVVMSTHGRTGLKRLFLGSNAERVVQHSGSPVLVVRQSEREFVAEGAPLQIQTILVPTDFSGSSMEALDYAVEFGRQFGARLVLFHSFSVPELITTDPYGPHNMPVTPEQARSAAEDQMREFVKDFDFGGVDFETQITTGRAAEEICDYAEKQKMDLIITSTHCRTGFMHVLIGSIAEHVVRYARSPVLVVPGSVKGINGPERGD
jgi:nucleotide-binding universal stress UspA family protein